MAPFPCKNMRETQEQLRKETNLPEERFRSLHECQVLFPNWWPDLKDFSWWLDIFLYWQHPVTNKIEGNNTFPKISHLKRATQLEWKDKREKRIKNAQLEKKTVFCKSEWSQQDQREESVRNSNLLVPWSPLNLLSFLTPLAIIRDSRWRKKKNDGWMDCWRIETTEPWTNSLTIRSSF